MSNVHCLVVSAADENVLRTIFQEIMLGGCALEIELGQNDSLVEIVASESIKEVPWELKTSVLNILRLWV